MHLMPMIEIFEDNYFTETENYRAWRNILADYSQKATEMVWKYIYHIVIIANFSFSLCPYVRIFYSDSICLQFHYV